MGATFVIQNSFTVKLKKKNLSELKIYFNIYLLVFHIKKNKTLRDKPDQRGERLVC